jgi:conjugal transfer/entry exclusion protein
MPLDGDLKCFGISSQLGIDKYLFLLDRIRSFLKPLTDHGALWTHINQYNLLYQCVKIYYYKQVTTLPPIDALSTALSESREHLIRIIKGKFETCGELTLNWSLSNSSNSLSSLQKEMTMLKNLIKLEVSVDDFDENLTTLMDMFTLFNCYLKYIKSVDKVVKNLDLKGCLNDEKTVELQSILEKCEESKRHYLGPKQASRYLKTLKATLMLDDSTKHMILFDEINECDAFLRFIEDQFFREKEKGDIEKGVQSFRSWHQIISNQLQNVEFEGKVLEHLSLAFDYILPFMDKSKNLQQLMNAVTELPSANGFRELRTVADNMHHIERWSSQAEVCRCVGRIHNSMSYIFLNIAGRYDY